MLFSVPFENNFSPTSRTGNGSLWRTSNLSASVHTSASIAMLQCILKYINLKGVSN